MGRTAAGAVVALNGGEVSALLGGRIDLEDRYPRSLELCENYVPMPQGPVTRRPGTYFIAPVFTPPAVPRLIPFLATGDTVYMLEFGPAYVRVIAGYDVVTGGVSPFDSSFSAEFGSTLYITTPYTEAQVWELQVAQAAGRMFICHRDVTPRVLTWTDDDTWALTELDFRDGPYLDLNVSTAATLDPVATSGTTNVVMNDTSDPYDAKALINVGTGWLSTDVGRHVRLGTSGATSGWGRIASVTAPPTVTASVTVVDAFADVNATTLWRVGVYSQRSGGSGNGYPGAVAIHENRLVLGGTPAFPSRIDFSVTGQYDLFRPDDLARAPGNAVATDATAVSLPDGVDVRWMRSDPRGLIVGTSGGVFLVRTNNAGDAISAVSPISVVKSVSHGADAASPVLADTSLIYAQRGGTKIRELTYVFDDDGLRSTDTSLVASHLLPGGVKQIAYQALPHSVVWVLRDDGVLLGMTFEKPQGVVAWFRVTLGGTAVSIGSIAVKASPGGASDDLWMVVSRTIDGGTRQYIEVLSSFWDATRDLADAVFSDCALTYDGVPVTTVTGLEHLNGETVAILTDGAVHPSRRVNDGRISLTRATGVAQVGLAYPSKLKTVRLEVGAANGTAQGKRKRIHRVIARLYQTLGARFGPSFDHLTEARFRTTNMAMGAPPSLFDGDYEVVWEPTWETEGYICVEQVSPVPGTLVAFFPQMQTEDRD